MVKGVKKWNFWVSDNALNDTDYRCVSSRVGHCLRSCSQCTVVPDRFGLRPFSDCRFETLNIKRVSNVSWLLCRVPCCSVRPVAFFRPRLRSQMVTDLMWLMWKVFLCFSVRVVFLVWRIPTDSWCTKMRIQRAFGLSVRCPLLNLPSRQPFVHPIIPSMIHSP